MDKKILYDEMRLKELRNLARDSKIVGWHEMRKSEMIDALIRMNPSPKKGGKDAASSGKGSASKKGTEPAKPTSKKKSKVISAPAPAPLASKEKDKRPSKPVVPPVTKATSPAPKKKSASKSLKGKKIIPSKLNVFTAEEIEREKEKDIGTADVAKPKKSVSGREEASPVRPSMNRQAGFLKEKLLLHKTLETPSFGSTPVDRIVLQVCGPFWLHAWWEISGVLISRVRAAMGHLWHTADPILRVYRVFSDGAGLIHREFFSDLVIYGGVYNWFINVDNPPGSFLVEIGYKARDGQFFSLVSSNIVETPNNYLQESFGRSEAGWRILTSGSTVSPLLDDAEGLPDAIPRKKSGFKERKHFEERLSDELDPNKRGFDLNIDAEVVIKGTTSPNVQLTIKGERVWLKEDGSFLIRYHLPERRHVFPVVAVSRDGIETKTIVLAIERNTKNLETVIRDQAEEDS